MVYQILRPTGTVYHEIPTDISVKAGGCRRRWPPLPPQPDCRDQGCWSRYRQLRKQWRHGWLPDERERHHCEIALHYYHCQPQGLSRHTKNTLFSVVTELIAAGEDNIGDFLARGFQVGNRRCWPSLSLKSSTRIITIAQLICSAGTRSQGPSIRADQIRFPTHVTKICCNVIEFMRQPIAMGKNQRKNLCLVDNGIGAF